MDLASVPETLPFRAGRGDQRVATELGLPLRGDGAPGRPRFGTRWERAFFLLALSAVVCIVGFYPEVWPVSARSEPGEQAVLPFRWAGVNIGGWLLLAVASRTVGWEHARAARRGEEAPVKGGGGHRAARRVDRAADGALLHRLLKPLCVALDCLAQLLFLLHGRRVGSRLELRDGRREAGGALQRRRSRRRRRSDGSAAT